METAMQNLNLGFAKMDWTSENAQKFLIKR